MSTPHIESFFDPATATVTHLLGCPVTHRAAVIDPVLDYDPKSGRTATHSAQQVLDAVQRGGWQVDWLLETHAHADHLSGAPWLQARVGGRIGIGADIGIVQRHFAPLLNLSDLSGEGREFDHLFHDGDSFQVGELCLSVMHTPGHTPACVSFQLEGHVFVGDTLFMPDYGSARCDFPGGDAHQLYQSSRRLFALPPDTQMHLCHDYPPAHRAPAWTCTVAEQRAHNIHLHDGVSEADFVALRRTRDATLGAPVLLWPSLQVNLRAGHLPEPEANGLRYMKTPIDAV
jgi:glyoxylase-like metal-dependent hydrolase (beta-lactamase superfamily II)